MIVIGLTGSVGMGKSTIARQFKQCGAAILDSDAVVHKLLGVGGEAVALVAKHFPKTLEKDSINRKTLGAEVFGDAKKLAALEAIIHPLVKKAQAQFIRRARQHKKQVVILDIPLLFETKGEERCDYTVVVTTPTFLQAQRVLKRLHMTHEKLAAILSRQMKVHEKRKRADFVIFTGLGMQASLRQVKSIIYRVTHKPVTEEA